MFAQRSEPEHLALLRASLTAQSSLDLGVKRDEGLFNTVECQKLVNKYDSTVAVQLLYSGKAGTVKLIGTEDEESSGLGRLTRVKETKQEQDKDRPNVETAEPLSEIRTGDKLVFPLGTLIEGCTVEKLAPRVDDNMQFIASLKAVPVDRNFAQYRDLLDALFLQRGTQGKPITGKVLNMFGSVHIDFTQGAEEMLTVMKAMGAEEKDLPKAEDIPAGITFGEGCRTTLAVLKVAGEIKEGDLLFTLRVRLPMKVYNQAN